MILASACLAGEKCRYDGKEKSLALIVKLKAKGKVVTVCPEVMGGLTTPRPPCEIVAGSGEDVLMDRAKIINNIGEDVTGTVVCGAKKSEEIAINNKIKLAILKSKSAACGKGKIYDGSFQKRLIDGNGVLTVLLEQQGIKVVDEESLFDF